MGSLPDTEQSPIRKTSYERALKGLKLEIVGLQTKALSEDAEVMAMTAGLTVMSPFWKDLKLKPVHTIQELLDRAGGFIKLEEAIKKVRGVAQPGATDYIAYLFLESRTDIDQEGEERSTANVCTAIDSSSVSKDEIEQGDSNDESPAIYPEDLEKESSDEESPYSPRQLRRGGSGEDSPSVSNNYQEQESSNEYVSYESSKESDTKDSQ
uniref:Uncharacterized protein n=1 Tax=Cannabis sativa TaxID=3483 RepID=A0A803QH39_CANSA